MEIILKTRDLDFNDIIRYKDLEISKKKITFITGESGSGKSTLLKLINGTLSPSKGEIYYNGISILNIDSIELRKEIILVSQKVFLFSGTIKDNFRQFYEYRNLECPSDERMIQFLEICQIPFSLDKDCSLMSGGERQRIYIAIFLSFEPKILMLDDPTSALDNMNSINVIENITHFCKHREIAVIIISHDNTLVERYAEEHIVLKKEV